MYFFFSARYNDVKLISEQKNTFNKQKKRIFENSFGSFKKKRVFSALEFYAELFIVEILYMFFFYIFVRNHANFIVKLTATKKGVCVQDQNPIKLSLSAWYFFIPPFVKYSNKTDIKRISITVFYFHLQCSKYS